MARACARALASPLRAHASAKRARIEACTEVRDSFINPRRTRTKLRLIRPSQSNLHDLQRQKRALFLSTEDSWLHGDSLAMVETRLGREMLESVGSDQDEEDGFDSAREREKKGTRRFSPRRRRTKADELNLTLPERTDIRCRI